MADLENVTWGQFKIGDLFNINTGSLLSKSQLTKGKTPRLSAKSDNNGVIGYFDTQNNLKARHYTNFISVNFFGTSGGIFYHPGTCSVEMKVHVLTLKNIELTKEKALFLITVLSKILVNYSYGTQLSSSKLKNLSTSFPLPILQNGEPDYDFMEEFIKELEQEQFTELDIYLQSTGLSDTKLTKAEQKALDDFDTLTWADFKIEDLFSVEKTKNKLKKDKLLPYSKDLFPVYSSESGNHGIVGYIEENPEYVLNSNQFMIVFGDHTRAINIAKESFSVCDNVKILSNSHNLSAKVSLFVITSWKKAIPNLGYNRHWKIASDVKFKLPQDPTDPTKPDFQYMETYIRAIEKLTIKDVVDLKDEQLA